ncbi:LLM class flavin-dependent oxidoreductase [Lapillicoccus jejuensis]|uniref:Luciferase-like monooxygenase n=1 Tax=Lapillicoccus jejuensis TaxID=402171 RepID=A0A542E0E5_9MICO|nr:LLM class flavin-dependent oxidoreductase [Lapillicoccus jejuensis]TQJ08786.1 luciferase-like monooxygenase [Lapillicoccus jejuensis]
MRLGATLVHLDDAAPYDVVRWARRLAAAGFESLWAPHVVGRGPLVPDPFTVLAAAAAVTQDVELGTATVQLPLLHPVDVAHRVLTLRSLCGERLVLGVSPGSTADDYAALDASYGTRFAVFRERAARLRTLLEEGGDGAARVAPRPGGRPAMLLGSWGRNVERAARDFEGWLASGYRTTPDEILAAHERFRAAGGRRAVVCAVPVRDDDDLAALGPTLRRYDAAGVDDAVLLLSPDGPPAEAARARFP